MQVDILVALVGVAVTIMVAGVPWAYNVHGRLCRIEAAVHEMVHDLRRNEKRIDSLEKDC